MEKSGFTIPEHIEAGVAITAADGDKEREQGPVIKTNIGTTGILRAAFCANQQRGFLPVAEL